MKKVFKYCYLTVAIPILFLWSIFFDSSGNLGLFIRDVLEDTK
ncbi:MULTISPECIES: hypothetical protein [Bacillaceae]|nr:hypothetical protein [Bacillus sp. Au-Bac7]